MNKKDMTYFLSLVFRSRNTVNTFQKMTTKGEKKPRAPASDAQMKQREIMGKVGKQAWQDLKDGKIDGLKYEGGGIAKYISDDKYKKHRAELLAKEKN